MSLCKAGRISGGLHLAIQYPKIAACLCALGLGYLSLGAVDLNKINTYCQKPTVAHYLALPMKVWPSVDKLCHCATSACKHAT